MFSLAGIRIQEGVERQNVGIRDISIEFRTKNGTSTMSKLQVTSNFSLTLIAPPGPPGETWVAKFQAFGATCLTCFCLDSEFQDIGVRHAVGPHAHLGFAAGVAFWMVRILCREMTKSRIDHRHTK